MILGPRKRLEKSERQARILELYHEGNTNRRIVEILAEEAAKGDKPKGWAIQKSAVHAEILRAIEYHRQQAVDFYDEHLTDELARCDYWIKQATTEWHASRTRKTERGRTTESGGTIYDETVTKAAEAELSKEVREWQERKLKLMGFVRENGTKDASGPGASQNESYLSYAHSLEQFAASVVDQSDPDPRPDNSQESIHPPPPDAPPSVISAS